MIFLAPFLLFFLLAVPGILWLVRATPPKPRLQTFSSLLLLRKLHPHRKNAAHTPLWLLILRISAITLLILSFSHPVWLMQKNQSVPKNLIIVLDNGWASTNHWEERRNTARILGERTLRAGGHLTLFLSARAPDGRWPDAFYPHNTKDLERYLQQTEPRPWPTERTLLANQLSTPAIQNALPRTSFIILSDGLGEHDDALRKKIHNAHDIRDVRWPKCDLIRLNRLSSQDNSLSIIAETLPNCPMHPLTLNGMNLNEKGQFNTIAHWSLQSGHSHTLTLPPALFSALNAISVPSIPSPAGLFLLNGGQKKPSVGILHLGGDNTPLTGSAFYLSHAIKNSIPLQNNNIKTSLRSPLSALIAPDGTLNNDEASKTILGWVQKGGVLIRFAGSDLAHQDESLLSDTDKSLLPVALLHGMRQLGGSMSWGSPQKLAPFPDKSPFFGLSIPKDVTISRQVLAQPTNDLQEHIWATLSDGTPLVTARREKQGFVILFHITPTVDWSTIPFSGLFPQMLERLIANSSTLTRSSTIALSSESETVFPIWKTLSSHGTLITPDQTIRPIEHNHTEVSATHPAGLYGAPPQLHPLNLADYTSPLRDEAALGTLTSPHLTTPDWPIWPSLALFSLVLLFGDMVLSLARQGHFPFIRSFATIFALISIGSFSSALAETHTARIPSGALEIHLAHILTGDEQTDNAVQQGLEGLTNFVNHRSTAHLESPIGVTPEHDDLSFYPVIYWPILPTAHTNQAQNTSLNNYMHHGGILLIDEMGAGSLLDSNEGTATHRVIKRVTAELDIPALTPINDDHTLSHAFYLLHDYPGRISGNPVYVARFDDNEGENVSPIIVGNADWAHAWAIDHNGNTPFAVIPDGESQRSLAYRFGFNTVIYALTGNYKNDQRHYPEMLHRLGNKNETDAAPDNEEGP